MLRVETDRRTARINRIAVDKANRLLATASVDKILRLWDVQTGDLLKTLRVPMDQGYDGKLFAVALSQDSRISNFTRVNILSARNLSLRHNLESAGWIMAISMASPVRRWSLFIRRRHVVQRGLFMVFPAAELTDSINH